MTCVLDMLDVDGHCSPKNTFHFGKTEARVVRFPAPESLCNADIYVSSIIAEVRVEERTAIHK